MKKLTFEEIEKIGLKNILFSKGDNDSGKLIDGSTLSHALISELILPDLGSVSSLYLSESHFKSVQFIERSLYGINLLDIQVTNCVFTKCNLRKVIFSGVTFNGTIFNECDFSRSQFSNCKLNNCIFTNCNLDKTIISESNLENCLFVGLLGDPILNNNTEENAFWKKKIS